MKSLQIAGLAGEPRQVTAETVAAFTKGLEGSLIHPDDEGFAEAIALWNGMIKKQPAVVVRARSVDDVVQTVDFARDNEVELSIKGGGHNIAGLALSDGGITLDLSGMRDVHVDAGAKLARVGPGCTLGDVDQATQPHGLATTLGFVSATGVAGLTLGGGFGYLSRRFGWTVDDLEAVEIVTADGKVLARVALGERGSLLGTARRRRQLRRRDRVRFQAPRGRPQGDGRDHRLAGSEADGVLDVFRRSTESSPRELTAVVLRRNAPPAPWLPEEAHGTPIIAILVCHSGDLEQAQADLAPIKATASHWPT